MPTLIITGNLKHHHKLLISLDEENFCCKNGEEFSFTLNEGWHTLKIEKLSILNTPYWLLKPFQLFEIRYGFLITFVKEVGYDADAPQLSMQICVKNDVNIEVGVNKILFDYIGPFVSRYHQISMTGHNAIKTRNVSARPEVSELYLRRWRISKLMPGSIIIVILLALAVTASVIGYDDLALDEWFFLWGGYIVFVVEWIYKIRKIKKMSCRVDELSKKE
jgi:hypothetical protein